MKHLSPSTQDTTLRRLRLLIPIVLLVFAAATPAVRAQGAAAPPPCEDFTAVDCPFEEADFQLQGTVVFPGCTEDHNEDLVTVSLRVPNTTLPSIASTVAVREGTTDIWRFWYDIDETRRVYASPEGQYEVVVDTTMIHCRMPFVESESGLAGYKLGLWSIDSGPFRVPEPEPKTWQVGQIEMEWTELILPFVPPPDFSGEEA